ncbi:VOC family protein [Devosia sp. CAU 1758]
MTEAFPLAALHALTPNLRVDDVEESLSFYRNLGFVLVQRVPATGQAIWAHVKSGGVRLMFQSRETLEEEFPLLARHADGGALTLWIQADDIAARFARVEGMPCVLKPLGRTEYNGATEFVLTDPDGFILHFSDLKLTTA